MRGAAAAPLLLMAAGAAADISAIKNTDYEFGYCSKLSPTFCSTTPCCDPDVRPTTESGCFTPTQNCCYWNSTAIGKNGACVHTDPCPAGQKICGGKCYPNKNADGVMTCIRSPGTDPRPGNQKPMYKKDTCIPKASCTIDGVVAIFNYLCGEGTVNCGEINPGGFAAYGTTGLSISAGVDDQDYSKAAWIMNQWWVIHNGQYGCDFSGCGMVVAMPVPPDP